ncbi:MAG: hypothetical protein ACI8W3_002518, partial [Myxococcota bacterium]
MRANCSTGLKSYWEIDRDQEARTDSGVVDDAALVG